VLLRSSRKASKQLVPTALPEREKSQESTSHCNARPAIPVPVMVITAVFAERKAASPGYQRYLDLDYAVRSTLSGSWHAVIHNIIFRERKTSWLLAGTPFQYLRPSPHTHSIKGTGTVVQKGIQDANTRIRKYVRVSIYTVIHKISKSGRSGICTAVLLRSTIDRGSGVPPSGYTSLPLLKEEKKGNPKIAFYDYYYLADRPEGQLIGRPSRLCLTDRSQSPWGYWFTR
jgi:hypothetical protein